MVMNAVVRQWEDQLHDSTKTLLNMSRTGGWATCGEDAICMPVQRWVGRGMCLRVGGPATQKQSMPCLTL